MKNLREEATSTPVTPAKAGGEAGPTHEKFKRRSTAHTCHTCEGRCPAKNMRCEATLYLCKEDYNEPLRGTCCAGHLPSQV